MKIIVKDNLGRDVTHDREWYISTSGKIFYYTGDIDCPLYVVDNDYTWEVDEEPQIYNWFEKPYNDWLNKYLYEQKPQTFEVNYPSCCDGCSNNPKNGGSGICNCTLPYIENPILYYTGDPCMANNAGGYAYIIDAKSQDATTTTSTNANRIAEAVERTKKYLKE